MAKFVITLSDNNGGVDLTAKNWGNERMEPATMSQEVGCRMIAWFRADVARANRKPWWRRWYEKK